MTKRLLEERVVSALSCSVDSDLVRMTAEEAEENIMTYWVYEDDPTRWTVDRAERVVKTVNFCSAITKFLRGRNTAFRSCADFITPFNHSDDHR